VRQIRRNRAQADTLLRSAWRTPLRLHTTTLSYCNLCSSTPVDCTLDAYSSPSPKLRVTLKEALLCRCRSNSVIMHYPICSVSGINSVYCIDAGALHPPETDRGRRTTLSSSHLRILSPVAILGLFLSPFAAPESVLSYTKPKYHLGFVHVPVSVFSSHACSLVVVRFISTPPISTILLRLNIHLIGFLRLFTLSPHPRPAGCMAL
jgi:hypothetical protein